MHDEGAERRGRQRVILLAAVTSVVSATVLRQELWSGRHGSWWLVAGLTALFVAGEMMPISIEFRRETHTFSFTSVPFVIGLFFLPPQLLVAARLAASVVVLAAIHRQPFYRLVTNLSTHLAEIVVATGIVALLTDHPDTGPGGWAVITLAVVAADLCGAAMVTAAISLFQSKFEPSLLSGLWLGALSIVVDLFLALVIVALAEASQAAVWLMGPIVVFILVLLRQYSAIKSRHEHVDLLYRLNNALSEAVLLGDVVPLLLRESADILHAEAAWLVRAGEGGATEHIALGPTEAVESSTADAFDRAVIEHVRSGGPATLVGGNGPMADDLVATGRSEAIVAALPIDAETSMAIVVADRSGTLRAFDAADVTLVGTLASHAGVVLRNMKLVDSLRAESDRNEELATHDSLTGLPNRTLIHAELDADLRRGQPLAVMLVDLDRFKEVNDTLGHQSGDRLLIEAGARMSECVAAGDMIARLGGDEFAVLVRSVESEAALVALAERIRESLCRTYQLADAEVEIGASVGVSIATPETADAATMLRQADVAMYAAKQDHLGVELYTAERDTHSRERLLLVGQLRSAIDESALAVHYQPLMDLQTGEVVGAEALVRWPRENAPMVMPDEFIAVAENTGLIRPLTQFVLRECVAQASSWHRRGLRIRLSLNLSPRNLMEADLSAQIAEMLRAAGLPPDRLQLELTESTVMSDPSRTIGILRKLRSTGVGLAIDDFGTGHSSLSYLTTLPATELKIDKSFVSAMEVDPASRTVVRSIVDLGRNLGLEVLAEGIETESQLESLRGMGCHIGQGYLFSRPLPLDDFERWLADAPAREATFATAGSPRRSTRPVAR